MGLKSSSPAECFADAVICQDVTALREFVSPDVLDQGVRMFVTDVLAKEGSRVAISGACTDWAWLGAVVWGFVFCAFCDVWF